MTEMANVKRLERKKGGTPKGTGKTGGIENSGLKPAIGTGKKNASGESAGAFGYILITATLFAAVMLLAISQKKPESYSALILVGKSVPESIEPNSTFTFGFEILNRGGKAGLYAYSVFLDGKQKTERKTVLEDGERRTFYEALIIDEKGEHKVSVIMVSPAQKTYEVFFKVETT